MTTHRAYLDHNATSPLHFEARAALQAALTVEGNPSSVHCEGRAARALIEQARLAVAGLAGAEPKWVTFTSGATEALTAAIAGAKVSAAAIVSAIEHPAALASCDARAGSAVIVPCSADGVVTPEAVLAATEEAERDPLVVVMLANNETGVIQPVAEISARVRAAHPDALIVCDAVQAPGRIAIDMMALGVDALVLSAHKMGGPKGVGALIVREDARERVVPLIAGGGQELRQRGGTENVSGIAGFGAVAKAAKRDLEQQVRTLGELRNDLEAGLLAVTPDAIIVARDVERLVNTSCILLPGATAETLVIGLDLEGVAASSGSACSSGKVGASHVLAAMGVPDDLARGAVRFSLGWNSTKDDVALALRAWAQVTSRLNRNRAAA